MMEHVELKFYWLYKYKWADGLTFQTNQRLTELEMKIGDCTWKVKYKYSITKGEKDDQ